MTCHSCEILIGEELSSLSGVSDVKIDHQTGQGKFRLDDTQTTLEAALDAVSRAGYKSRVVNEVTVSMGKPFRQERKKGAETPFKLKIESKIEANGKILEDTNGKPYFEGMIINSQSAEMDSSEAKTSLKDIINHIFKTAGSIQAVGENHKASIAYAHTAGEPSVLVSPQGAIEQSAMKKD